MKNNFFLSEFAKKSRFHWDFVKNIKHLEKWVELSENFSSFQQQSLSLKKNEDQIPKIIHQIWIGPKKIPNKYLLWGKSWKKLNPDWDYKFWTDSEIEKIVLINKKYYDKSKSIGYKSDIARYEILKQFGGIYVDTDFECIRPIPEDFINFDFVSCTVFSNEPEVNNAIMMSKINSKVINKIINNIKFENKYINPIKTINASGATILTDQYFSLNSKEKEKCLILPSNYFYPYPNFLINRFKNVNQFITNETVGIHHWEMSWMKRNLLKRILKKLISFFIQKNN